MAEQQKKIIWVEDDQALIDVYTYTLNGNFNVEFMKFGRLAMDRIKEIEQNKVAKPGLIILDLELPDMNGATILEELKKTSATKDIPVFILTNCSEEQIQKRLTEELKADKYLIKTDYPPRKLLPLIEETFK